MGSNGVRHAGIRLPQCGIETCFLHGTLSDIALHLEYCYRELHNVNEHSTSSACVRVDARFIFRSG